MTRVAILAGALFLILGRTWPIEGVSGLRLWSLSPTRYLGYEWTVLPLLALATVAVMASSPRLRRTIDTSRDIVGSRWFESIVVVGTAAMFALLSSKYALLGDNLLRVSEAIEGKGSPNERGLIWLYHECVVIGSRFGLDGRQTFQTVSILSGAAYASVTRLLSRDLADSPAGQIGIWVVLLSSGVVALFCGYVEVYPPLLPLLMLLTWVSIRATKDQLWYGIPILVWAAASFLHRGAILWAPVALTPLLFRHPKISYSSLAGRSARVVVAAILALGVLAAIVLTRSTSLLIRLSPTETRPYSLLSLEHLSDFSNAQLLGSAGAFVFLPWILMKWAREERVSGESLVLLLAWIVPAVALFLFNPVLGAADWDVLALAAPFGALFVASFRRCNPALVGISLAVTLPWLGLLRSEASIEWYSDLVKNDRADYYQTHPAPLHLSFVLSSNGRDDLARTELEQSIGDYPEDPRLALGLAARARNEGRWKDAVEYAGQAYSIQRGYLPALDILYDAFRELGLVEEQLGAGMTLLEAHRKDPLTVERYLALDRLQRIRAETQALRP